MKRIITAFLALTVLLLCGCKKHEEEILSLADMADKALVIGVPEDINANDLVMEVCPNATIVPQNDVMYGVRAVRDGKADAYVVGRVYIEKAIHEDNVKNVRILDDPLISYQCALGLSKKCSVPDYVNAVNAALERLIADGTIEEMRNRWFIAEDEQMPEITLDDDPVYTLNAVTYGQCKPYSYFKDGVLTGFDVELIMRVCQMNHWGMKLDNAEYQSMLMGLSTGKYDVISANLYVTEGREENITYSIPFTNEEISVAVRRKPVTAEDTEPEYKSLSDLKNAKSFAVQTGTIFDQYILERYPDAEIKYFDSAVNAALAVANGKADATAFDAPVLRYLAAVTDGTEMLPDYLAKDKYYFILSKSERGEKLQKEFNEWLSVQKENGEVSRLYDFWCGDDEPHSLGFEALPAPNGIIHVAVDPSSRPDVFLFNNKLTGFPLELIYNFCCDRGYGVEFTMVAFDSMIPCLVSGKADITATFLSYTEERAESVLYTDTIVEGGVGVLVRSVKSQGDNSLLAVIKNGLYRTFIAEERWKLIGSGLLQTIVITVLGFLLANIFGAALCACMLSRKKGLHIVSDIFDRIMQGTPMVVILMILYYVIFGHSDISGTAVAILAFGMTSGASLARLFYGSITGVDKGQTEAALAIGFTKAKAFLGIVFPQAARTALTGYFSEIIGLMKGTAIVGYISVIDLTKSGDLIRSSTYDAFFPLLSVAIIYFLITFVLLSLLKCVRKKLSPKRVTAKEAEK